MEENRTCILTMVATMKFRIFPQHEGCFVSNLFEIVPVVRSGEEDENLPQWRQR